MYHCKEDVAKLLESRPDLQTRLYCRGYLLTDEEIRLNGYPFYDNWQKIELPNTPIKIYAHYETDVTIIQRDNKTYFIIGHAYDPYEMAYQEDAILSCLADLDGIDRDLFWAKTGDLTGVYVLGVIESCAIRYTCDCTGMLSAYYGIIDGHIFLTSHCKLVADMHSLSQEKYIQELTRSKFYHYFGRWLPGDRTPFRELVRSVPNFAYVLSVKDVKYERFFPKTAITAVESEDEYQEKLQEIDSILQRTMNLIAKKWPNRRAAISVTGGRDSTTTLAAAKDVYGELQYFSYISVEKERIDAEAASRICNFIDVPHTIYYVPDNDDDVQDIDVHRIILECNAGCIGKNNANDSRKRAYFSKFSDFDVEVKSWVGELSRAEAQSKYKMTKWPDRPSVGYYRCMWKVILSPKLIHQSNMIFGEYLSKYYNDDVFDKMDWTDLFFWEFSWPGGEGHSLTSEHKYAYDVTIPYNNRHLLKTMLETPLEKRLDSSIQKDSVERLDSRIVTANSFVRNITHTNMWSTILRVYLKVFSKLTF